MPGSLSHSHPLTVAVGPCGQWLSILMGAPPGQVVQHVAELHCGRVSVILYNADTICGPGSLESAQELERDQENQIQSTAPFQSWAGNRMDVLLKDTDAVLRDCLGRDGGAPSRAVEVPPRDKGSHDQDGSVEEDSSMEEGDPLPPPAE